MIASIGSAITTAEMNRVYVIARHEPCVPRTALGQPQRLRSHMSAKKKALSLSIGLLTGFGDIEETVGFQEAGTLAIFVAGVSVEIMFVGESRQGSKTLKDKN